MLTASPVKTKNFNWDVSLLVNHNKNKITELYRSATFIAFDGATQGALLGYPVGVYYVNYYAKKPDGNFIIKRCKWLYVTTGRTRHCYTRPRRKAN